MPINVIFCSFPRMSASAPWRKSLKGLPSGASSHRHFSFASGYKGSPLQCSYARQGGAGMQQSCTFFLACICFKLVRFELLMGLFAEVSSGFSFRSDVLGTQLSCYNPLNMQEVVIWADSGTSFFYKSQSLYYISQELVSTSKTSCLIPANKSSCHSSQTTTRTKKKHKLNLWSSDLEGWLSRASVSAPASSLPFLGAFVFLWAQALIFVSWASLVI